MVSIVLAVLTLTIAASSVDSMIVRGVVRSDATGAPIVGATVAVVGGTATALSDASGWYELRGLARGARRLRFAAHDHEPLLLGVTIAGQAPLRLDVALRREPQVLPLVRVVASAPAEGGDAAPPSGVEAGRWGTSGAAMRVSPVLDEADAFRLLAATPTASTTVEGSTAVHVRGGSADQNLFLLDGLPVHSPLHAGRLLSAFSPDIVDEMIVHGAAPPARYGGGLSSIVEIRTPSSSPVATASGGFGPTAFRAAVQLPIVADRAGLLVSGRRSYSGVRRGDAAEVEMPGSWFDAFGKLSLRVGGADVVFSSFTADNGLGFAAGGLDARNRFEWTTVTNGLTVRRPLGARATLDVQLWRARFDALAAWRPDSGAFTLGSGLRDAGGRAVAVLRRPTGERAIGVEVQQLRTRYVLEPTAPTGTPGEATPRGLVSRPTVASVFVEETRRLGDRWTLSTGLRGTTITGQRPRLEPRLGIQFRPWSRLALTGGYARMHQYTQSLRNEESLVGTILGPDLPVAVGADRVPIASSDELTATVVATHGRRSRLHLEWYDRRLHGLVMVAPFATGPFATGAFGVGAGRARGLGSAVEWRDERVTVVGSFAMAIVERRMDGNEYRPGFASTQTLTIGAAYRAGRRTTLRSTVGATSGRRTAAVADDVEWDTRDPVTGAREISGTPGHAAGPVNGDHLPAYLRFDAGLRHTLRLSTTGSLTGFASVNNLLSRSNVAAFATRVDGARRGLAMLPLSVVLGLDWTI